MKIRFILSMLVLMSFVFSACQSKPNEPPALPTTAGGNPPVTYPSPTAPKAAAPGPAIYPDAKSGDTINWGQARAMVLNGEASKIALDASLKVTLSLKDGRQFVSSDPVTKDELDKVVKACGNNCKTLQVTTQ